MSTKRSKRYQEAAKLVTPNKNYSITEAVETMKSFPAPKFDPTVTVSFHLTVDCSYFPYSSPFSVLSA